MKKEILFLAALATCLSSFGQTFEKTAQGGKFQTAQPTLNGEVIFYSPSIVRIVKYPSAEMPEKKSYPVIKTPEKVEISYKQNGNTVSMTSGKMTVTLDVVTGKVTYTDLKGETLLKEKVEGTNFIPRKDVNRDAFTGRSHLRIRTTPERSHEPPQPANSPVKRQYQYLYPLFYI